MSRSSTWTNSDGLVIGFGIHTTDGERPGETARDGIEKELIVDFSYNNLPGATASDGGKAFIPAGSYLVSATLIVGTVWTSETDLDIGTETLAGVAIDADGIDVTLDAAALTAGAVIACDGADIGTVIDASNDAYIVATSAAATAGTARLVVRYLQPYSA